MTTNGPKKNTAARAVTVALTLATQLIVSVLLGFFLGKWLDGLLHTDPWLSIVGVVAGIGTGFYGLYHLSRILLK